MPTIGWSSAVAPVEPKKPASPKLKIPPSAATSQYPVSRATVSGRALERPPGVSTVTPVAPPMADGTTAVIWVNESTTKLVAGIDPKRTWVALLKPTPVMVTVLSPAGEPWAVLTEVALGAGV